MRLALGTLLRDKYQIVRKLADGEEGEVFEARHVDLAGRYAVKFLCEGGIRNALLLDELRREALATSVLTHPGIVRVSDLDQAPDGSPFLVTEFLNGQDLGRVVRRAVPMALGEVAAIVEAIACSPLAQAHGRGIVHGDLTPEKVFVLDVEADTAARVKILDFGVAKIRARAGGLVRNAGGAEASPYAPPERQRGRDWEVDARADVFSLGAIAHALISGRAPTRVTAAGPAASGVRAPALPVPPAVATVLERAMRNDREARFQSVTDFAQTLGSRGRLAAEAVQREGGASRAHARRAPRHAAAAPRSGAREREENCCRRGGVRAGDPDRHAPLHQADPQAGRGRQALERPVGRLRSSGREGLAASDCATHDRAASDRVPGAPLGRQRERQGTPTSSAA